MRKYLRLTAQFFADARGTGSVFAICILPMFLALTGLAMDGGMAFTARAQSQAAADAASLAATAILPNDDAQVRLVAYNYANANFDGSVLDTNKTADVVCGKYDAGAFTADTTTGACNNTNNNAVRVITRKTVGTTFLQLIGMKQWNVATDAIATITNKTNSPCVLAKGEFLVNGTAVVSSPSCEFDALKGGFNGPAATIQAKKLCNNSIEYANNLKQCTAADVISTACLQTGTGCPKCYSPLPTTDCTVAKDPYAAILSKYVKTPGTETQLRDNNGNVSQSLSNVTRVLDPGTYGAETFSNSTITLNPGFYIIDGPWYITDNTKLVGTGVTLYFSNSGAAFHLQNNASAELSASDDGSNGAVPGTLMFENPASVGTGQAITLDHADHVFSGLIYLPTRDFTLNSGAQLYNKQDQITLVVNNLRVNSGSLWSFKDYDSQLINPTGSIKMALVH